MRVVGRDYFVNRNWNIWVDSNVTDGTVYLRSILRQGYHNIGVLNIDPSLEKSISGCYHGINFNLPASMDTRHAVVGDIFDIYNLFIEEFNDLLNAPIFLVDRDYLHNPYVTDSFKSIHVKNASFPLTVGSVKMDPVHVNVYLTTSTYSEKTLSMGSSKLLSKLCSARFSPRKLHEIYSAYKWGVKSPLIVMGDFILSAVFDGDKIGFMVIHERRVDCIYLKGDFTPEYIQQILDRIKVSNLSWKLSETYLLSHIGMDWKSWDSTPICMFFFSTMGEDDRVEFIHNLIRDEVSS